MKKSMSLIGIFVCLAMLPATGFAHGGDDHLQQAVDKIAESYLKIKEHLANDSLKGIASEAKKINDQAMESGKSKHGERDKVQLIAEMGKHANHMGHGKIKDIREHFSALSRSLIRYTEKFGHKKGELYVYYCPMNKEYWLQDNKETANPYAGKKMATCGNIVAKADKEKMMHELEGKSHAHHGDHKH